MLLLDCECGAEELGLPIEYPDVYDGFHSGKFFAKQGPGGIGSADVWRIQTVCFDSLAASYKDGS